MVLSYRQQIGNVIVFLLYLAENKLRYRNSFRVRFFFRFFLLDICSTIIYGCREKVKKAEIPFDRLFIFDVSFA